MDQVKTGKFIAQQRKLNGLTQQQLGDLLGVSNKTVSRWENGNYMPDIEMIQLISKALHISINEILAGKILPETEFAEQADNNIVQISRESAFSFAEQKRFWIRKWRKEHIGFFILLFLLDIGFIIYAIISGKIWLLGCLGALCLIEYGWQNNLMMIYVENKLYEK